MALTIDCVLIDFVDLDAMTAFWCEALDLDHVWTGPSGGHLPVARDGSGCRLGLMPGSDDKTSSACCARPIGRRRNRPIEASDHFVLRFDIADG
jgi:hypothetical protein